ncbi:MAG: hypothetical protein HON98_09250 [Chloroflexi bacterium]|nr:hypothetical protein [Chloroflexota bacterium]MBT3668972.1 hypothetical protein [Chloroflexota bacterium]MBT4002973.1 hypothetical protein [Chloroflexota bacterium]MBT4304943.1 hypothetical protein [Chloroflexota bacterium]MBT4533294.1 hypothetical protein [Chloroflexota bacterium]
MKSKNLDKGAVSRIVLLSLLTIFLIIQIINLVPQTYSDLVFIRQNIGQTATNRGSRMFGGNAYGEKIEFLGLNVPEDVDLVLPPEKLGISQFGSSSALAYYLAPRKFESCGSSYIDCIEHYKDTHAIIYFDMGEDLTQIGLNPGQIIMMDDAFGVIVPETSLGEIPLANQSYDRIEQVFIDLGAGMLFSFGFVLIGYFLMDGFFQKSTFLVKISLGFGLGTGLFSFLLYLALLIGIPLSSAVIWGLYIGMITVSLGILILKIRKQDRKIEFPNIHSIDWMSLPIFLLGGIAIVLAVGKGYFQTDGIILWGSKGFGIARDGLIKGVSGWGTSTAAYPLNIPLLIATYKTLFNELIPQSKLIFPFYYLSLLIFTYSILKDNIGEFAGLLSALILGTIPTIFLHGTIAYANLVAGFYFCAGVLLLTGSLWKDSQKPNGMGILGGILIALGAWSRPETATINMVLIVLIGSIGLMSWRKKEGKHKVIWAIFPLILFSILWNVTYSNVYVNMGSNDSTVLFTGLKEFLGGNLHIKEALYLIGFFFKSLFDVKIWGFLGWSLGLSIILLFVNKRFRKELLPPFLLGFTYIFFVIVSYHLLGYKDGGTYDISWWATTGLLRMAIPGILVVWVTLVKTLGIEREGIFLGPDNE